MDANTDTFGAIAPAMRRSGWDVIPLPAGSKAPRLKAWQEGLTIEQVDRLASNGYADGNVGLLAARFPALDIDVKDETMATWITQEARKTLGEAPCRIGAPPKRLLAYTCDVPFTKRRLDLAAPDGSAHAVEVLGEGQQYVISGRHPDGHQYRWEGEHLSTIEPLSLSVITGELVDSFLRDLASRLPEGWSVKGVAAAATNVAVPATDDETALAHYRGPLDGWTLERVTTEIMPHLDPDMSQPEWVGVGMALHHQGNGAPEWLALWDEWSQGSSKYKGGECKSKWRGFRDKRLVGNGPVTLGSLVRMTADARRVVADAQVCGEVDSLLARIQTCEDPRRLETELAAEAAGLQLLDVDKARIAAAIQKRSKGLGVPVPIATVRLWLSPRGFSAEVFQDLTEDGRPASTLQNFGTLMARVGFTIRYNAVSKDLETLIPGSAFTRDNRHNAAYAHVLSECERVGMNTRHVRSFIVATADKNVYNPVMTWVESRPWDGTSRLQAYYDTVTSSTPAALKHMLMRKWAVQCIAAAASPDGIANQGILTFMGPQNIGKTTWFQRLAPAELELILTGLTLDTRSKDSCLVALSHWIVELGEIDATFRKSDLSGLKAFVSQPVDKIRRPYAEAESQYGRRTAFGASVNDEQFLHDPTGNRRFWVVEASAFNLDSGIDWQQFWAEILTLFRGGEKFNLTQEELKVLNENNEQFVVADPIHERIQGGFAWASPADEVDIKRLTPTAALRMLGIDNPSKPQTMAAGVALRKLSGVKAKHGETGSWYPVPVPKSGLTEAY